MLLKKKKEPPGYLNIPGPHQPFQLKSQCPSHFFFEDLFTYMGTDLSSMKGRWNTLILSWLSRRPQSYVVKSALDIFAWVMLLFLQLIMSKTELIIALTPNPSPTPIPSSHFWQCFTQSPILFSPEASHWSLKAYRILFFPFSSCCHDINLGPLSMTNFSASIPFFL